MAQATTRGRTTGDLVIGGLIVLVGLIILGDVAVATTVSILFLGWVLLIGGVIGLVGSLVLIGKDGFWAGALGGGLLAVMGLVCLRHTEAAAVTLTLVAGAMFLVSGLVRLAAASQVHEGRVALLLGGGVSTLLGLLVLFNLVTASYGLLGVILGIDALAEGISIMLVGRDALATARWGGGSPATP